MTKRPNPTLVDDASPEWTEADFKQAKRLHEMPAEFQQTIRRARGPQKAPTKIPVTIRLSPDVVEKFKASGPGWQTRVDVVLREWLATH
ncbi:MAG: hypothetical protein GAK30_03302 [Paracidovorax wautersii]|uniref:BrnA antitoxin of type II toxin-antitoxin system n=1 Tax=Paracidovorax wautersii TaxID=1177982 RepID=A0A7V8FLD4_9BURK|nr:MAG: hypothetical protein GAK30_03302 [Paracidovorax wautersii]